MSSEDFDMNDSTWMSADPHLASSLSPSQDERMRSPQNLHSQEDGECLLVAGGGEAVQDNRGPGIWARTSGGGGRLAGAPTVCSASPWAPLSSSWFQGDRVIPPKDKWMALRDWSPDKQGGLFVLMLRS